MTLKDKPAYPRPIAEATIGNEKIVSHPFDGITLFESFVKAAMQGYCANPDVITKFSRLEVSRMAIAQALTQIEALEKHYEAEKAKQEGKS